MRRHLTVLAAGLTLSGLAITPSALAADGFTVPPSPSDLGLDVGVVYARLPSVNGFGFAVDDLGYDFIRQYDHSQAIEGAGPGVSLHLGLPDFATRGWFGDAKMNIDIDAFWIMDTVSAHTNLASGEFLDMLPVNGGPTFDGLYFGNPASIKSKGDANLSSVDVAWTLEHPMGDRGMSVLFGPRFAYQAQSYSVTTSSSLETFEFLTKENVSAYFVGPEIGVRKVGPLGGGATYELIARAAALYLDSHLDAAQKVLVGGSSVFKLNGHDNNDGFSGRVELGSGVTMPFPNSAMLLSLNGSVTWWSAVPQVVNPRSGPGVNAASKNFRAASLSTGDMWTAKAMAKVTVPLD